jgi:hypothetical protein
MVINIPSKALIRRTGIIIVWPQTVVERPFERDRSCAN